MTEPTKDTMPALSFQELQTAVAAAKQQFELVRQKYPALQAYLVLSLPGGQTGIGSSPKEILNEFSGMVIDSPPKRRATQIQSRLDVLEWKLAQTPKSGPLLAEKMNLTEALDQLLPHLRYDGNCRVELRFRQLDYDLIWQLQAEALVDRDLTPQMKASIRIVLGTLAQFTGRPHEH